MKKILIVEDDPAIGNALSSDLADDGYGVTWVGTLKAARQSARNLNFDLLLLDLNLPDGLGFEFCKEYRAESPQIPIIIITAKTDEDTAVKGLSLGATDFIRKPFGRRELTLRIKKSLGSRSGQLELGKLSLNLDQRLVLFENNPLPLTPIEFKILAALLKSGKDVTRREYLLGHVDEEGEMLDVTLRTHLSRLRKKMKDAGVTDIKIVHVYGTGYRLERK